MAGVRTEHDDVAVPVAGAGKERRSKARSDTCTGFRGVRRSRHGRPVPSKNGAGADDEAKTTAWDSSTVFRGVRRTRSGKYVAQTWNPTPRATAYLGTIRTAEEAARAFNAAAIKLRGARAKTNFMPPDAADNGDAAPALPAPSKSCDVPRLSSCAPSTVPASGAAEKPGPPPPQQTADASDAFQPEDGIADLDLLHDFPGLDNIIPIPQLDDLGMNLSPTGWQEVHEFLDHADFRD